MAWDIGHRLLHLRINLMHTPVPATKGFLELLKDLFTTEEAWLVFLMPPLPAPAWLIALTQFKKKAVVEKMAQDLVRRGLLFDFTIKGQKRYMVPVGIPGFIELQLMKAQNTPEERRFAQQLRTVIRNEPDEFYGQYDKMGSSFARVVPINQSVSADKAPLPYEDVRNIILRAKKLALVNCYCRQEKRLLGEKTCDAPDECCMALNMGADFVIRNGFGREVDQAAMLHKLEEAEKYNLVHMTDNNQDYKNTFICNCCGCCCGMLGAMTKFDRKGPFVLSSLLVELDKARCNNCGRCVRTCNVNALATIHKVTVFNQARCIGCGNCLDACPHKALSAADRPDWQAPPENYGAMVADLMDRRFSGPLNIGPFKIPMIRKFVAGKVNAICEEGNKF